MGSCSPSAATTSFPRVRWTSSRRRLTSKWWRRSSEETLHPAEAPALVLFVQPWVLLAALSAQAAPHGLGRVLRAERRRDRSRSAALFRRNGQDRLRRNGEEDVEDDVAFRPGRQVGHAQRAQVFVLLRPLALALEDDDLEDLLVVLAGPDRVRLPVGQARVSLDHLLEAPAGQPDTKAHGEDVDQHDAAGLPGADRL